MGCSKNCFLLQSYKLFSYKVPFLFYFFTLSSFDVTQNKVCDTSYQTQRACNSTRKAFAKCFISLHHVHAGCRRGMNCSKIVIDSAGEWRRDDTAPFFCAISSHRNIYVTEMWFLISHRYHRYHRFYRPVRLGEF